MHVRGEASAIQLLEQIGAVQQGHVIGTNGPHLDAYVAKDVPTRYPTKLRLLIKGFSHVLPCDAAASVDVVVAAPMGALSGGLMLAEELGVEYAYLEEVTEGEGDDAKSVLKLKRDLFIEAVRGKRVGIYEDIVNTGGTTIETVAAVEAAGGTVVWVACLWSRSGLTANDLGVPAFYPLVNKRLGKWNTYEACLVDGPCSRREPVREDLGHPEKFTEREEYEALCAADAD